MPLKPAAASLSVRALRWLRARWRGGSGVVVAYDWFLPAEVERLHTALAATRQRTHPQHKAHPALDDATWRDLELGRYLDALARHTSLFGRQVLMHRLRASTWLAPEERLHQRLHPDGPPTSDDELADSQPPDEAGAAALDAAWAALQPLRTVDIDLAGLLFSDPLPTTAPWVQHLWAVPAAFALAAGLAATGLYAAAALLAAVTLVVSARVQVVLYGPLLLWERQRRAIVVLLQAATTAAAAAAAAARHNTTGSGPALLQGVQALAASAHALCRSLQAGWVSRIPALAEYANLVALTEYRRLGRDWQRLPARREALQQVFLAVAGLEADLTLRGHLRHGPATCAATPATGLSLAFTELVHPLLDQPHPLSLQLNSQGAFITGQNGAGKSTLLRSVGLNVVVGQAFGFCYARAAQVPRVLVCSSLQIEDSLGTATSLYMAELTRARWLCTAAALPGGALLLVDEIFRGTNPQESMAATAALAHELARTALLMMATHHRQLAAGLAPDLQPWCVAVDARGMQTLLPGVLQRTNGLAMLADYGFSDAMRAHAERVFNSLQNASGSLQGLD